MGTNGVYEASGPSPALVFKGAPSWPPAWHWLGDGINRHPKGEVGILRQVKVPSTTPFNRCFLVIEYKNALYMGCLITDDLAFGIAFGRFLRQHYGAPIDAIGSLDMSHTL